MSEGATQRRVVTSVTLLAAVVAVVVMALWGVNAATAPIEDDGPSAGETGPTCPPEQLEIKEFITRGEVTVSVYNTGKRKGRAGDTLTLLENAGFKPGAIGNGEAGDTVRRAEVRTTDADDPDARLVAKSLGRNVPVVVTEEAYGPGVDVFIGDRFRGLDPDAPRRERLAEPEQICQ